MLELARAFRQNGGAVFALAVASTPWRLYRDGLAPQPRGHRLGPALAFIHLGQLRKGDPAFARTAWIPGIVLVTGLDNPAARCCLGRALCCYTRHKEALSLRAMGAILSFYQKQLVRQKKGK
jgi:hypothetical protein